MDRDEELRTACFDALTGLRQWFLDEIPYRGALDAGFQFQGRRVPFLNYQKGIYRAAVQHGPAALSINTSYDSPYDDQSLVDGFAYAYRSGDPDQPDNRALRAAWALQAPLAYFVASRPGWYQALYPCYLTHDSPAERMVIVSVGHMLGRQPQLPAEQVERVYTVRTARQRLHQGRFRGLVLPAYRDQCAICRLKETRLLDAAHIIRDSDPEGVAAVRNGLSLCTIHHRAFDQNLVGVSPDYQVKVAGRLLDDEDGPMLDLLKGFHDTTIFLPREPRRPDRDRLALRFDEFEAAAA
ncbi:MAG: HNH endonuclease [Gaiellales bacterium]